MQTGWSEGYATVGDLSMYWRSAGSGGVPLVLVHGGYGLAESVAGPLAGLAERRRVVAVELQGHGHTADVDRPLTLERLGDDLAGLIEQLGLAQVDLLGYSVGAGACLRAAIQHPGRVRRLVVVSAPFRRSGWFPDVLAAFDTMSSAGFDILRQSPLHAGYTAVAPDPQGFAALMDKTGELLRRPYDWSQEVAGLPMPLLLVYGDADSIPPAHAAAFFALLGGGVRDPGWDGAQRPASQLAVLPGRTHYDVLAAPELAGLVDRFLAAPEVRA